MTLSPTPKPFRSQGSNRLLLVGCVLLVGCAGCSSETSSPLERFERLPSVEELVTLPLGEYLAPIPLAPGRNEQGLPLARAVQFEFTLYAAVTPKHVPIVENNFELNEGRIRQSVIEVCRNTPIEDLLDPPLTTLKAHLADELRPYFRYVTIERFHIDGPQVKQL